MTHHTVHWMEWKWVSQCHPSKDPEGVKQQFIKLGWRSVGVWRGEEGGEEGDGWEGEMHGEEGRGRCMGRKGGGRGGGRVGMREGEGGKKKGGGRENHLLSSCLED